MPIADLVRAAVLVLWVASAASAQPALPLAPAPKPVTMDDLGRIDELEGQLVQMTALVRHTDTAQVFTFGARAGREVHVVIPAPATAAAHVGDTVAVTGFVRRFSGSAFERDYSWFRRLDYPDVRSGDWVIVATSVRTAEGTELVPPGVISNTPPAATPPPAAVSAPSRRE